MYIFSEEAFVPKCLFWYNGTKRELTMQWTEVLALMGAVFVANMGVMIPMFLWNRAEANADRREMRAVAAEDRRDILMLIREIKEEMKDFHGRLCAIEEKKKG
jgi:hypothetical protein